jgi:hypothetical protein
MTLPDGLPLGLASLQRESAAGRTLPPVERWNPAHCGDIDIRIARDGTWFHQGSPFTRRELVRLFSTILRKDADGFHLVTPARKCASGSTTRLSRQCCLRDEGEGSTSAADLHHQCRRRDSRGPDNPIRVETHAETGEPAPYVHVRRGLEARISRNVFLPTGRYGRAG